MERKSLQAQLDQSQAQNQQLFQALQDAETIARYSCSTAHRSLTLTGTHTGAHSSTLVARVVWLWHVCLTVYREKGQLADTAQAVVESETRRRKEESSGAALRVGNEMFHSFKCKPCRTLTMRI